MKIQKKSTGIAMAAAAAALFAAGAVSVPTVASAGDGNVKCFGVNACKGHGKCAGAGNACAGHNACKGQGWVPADSAKDCKDQGGHTGMKKGH